MTRFPTTLYKRSQVMLGSRIPDEVVMRYADGELPLYLQIPIRAALVLSPRLRQRVRNWRRFSATTRELCAGSATLPLMRRHRR